MNCLYYNFNYFKRSVSWQELKVKKQQKRLEFENKSLQAKGAKGSFVVFREEGLEDVFIIDDL